MRVKISFIAAALITAFAISAGSALAQDTRGTIVGTVTDPNGGVVANATVQVKDPSRGTTRLLPRTATAYIERPSLPPAFIR